MRTMALCKKSTAQSATRVNTLQCRGLHDLLIAKPKLAATSWNRLGGASPPHQPTASQARLGSANPAPPRLHARRHHAGCTPCWASARHALCPRAPRPRLYSARGARLAVTVGHGQVSYVSGNGRPGIDTCYHPVLSNRTAIDCLRQLSQKIFLQTSLDYLSCIKLAYRISNFT